MKKTISQRFHLHPITSHFPSAFLPFSTLFLVLLIIKGDNAYLLGVKYTQWAAVVTNPFAIVSGLMDWKSRYKGARVPIFKKKILFSAIVQVLVSGCVAWHSITPRALSADGYQVYIYLALTITATVFIFLVGRWGARLVYL